MNRNHYKNFGIAGIIRRASADDALGIYSILRQAFSPLYLKFTIYQKSESASYLREQIEAGNSIGTPTIFVADRAGTLSGFYIADECDREFFLSYIATGIYARGKGIGRKLLLHFEGMGSERGCAALGLEVFESNNYSVEWYLREGYRPSSKRYVARFDLAAFQNEGKGGLVLDSFELDRAFQKEEKLGFSCISGFLSDDPVKIGLIGEDVANVLSPRGPGAFAVAEAIAQSPLANRRWILLTTYEPILKDDGLDSLEISIHMVKKISRRDQAR